MRKNILLLGGSGFVGTAITNRLSQLGYNITIPVRRRERSKDLILLPNVNVIECNLFAEQTLNDLVSNNDVVINLIGILHSNDVCLPYAKDFANTHVKIPQLLVNACRLANKKRLIHISAINAASDAPSEYLRSKGDGEKIITAAADLDYTIFRPSVIFGRNDKFTNSLARMIKILPSFIPFPLASADARFQPVSVNDVADAIVASIANPTTFKKCFELCGPKTYSLRDIIIYLAKLQNKKIRIFPLSEYWSYWQAGLMWLFPRPLLSPDNLRSMLLDSVKSKNGIAPLNWQPEALENIVPNYIGEGFSRAKISKYRDYAHR